MTNAWKLFELDQRIAYYSGEASRLYASAMTHLFDALALPPLSIDRLGAEAAAAHQQKSASAMFRSVLRLRAQRDRLAPYSLPANSVSWAENDLPAAQDVDQLESRLHRERPQQVIVVIDASAIDKTIAASLSSKKGNDR
jgi:uncharacterized small protein (DUF1192 family)